MCPSLSVSQTVDDDAMEAWMRFGVAIAERCPRVGVLKPPSWRTSHPTPTWWKSRVGRRWGKLLLYQMHAHSAGITAYNLSKQLSNNPSISFYPKSFLKNYINYCTALLSLFQHSDHERATFFVFIQSKHFS